MKDLAIYGAGGFGKEVACLVNAINKNNPEWNLIGFFDDGYSIGESNRFGKILGGINELNNWKEKINIVFSIANPVILQELVSKIENNNILFPNLFAPDLNFLDFDSLKIGKGNLFFFGVRISCEVTVGDFNLCNGFASLGHEVEMGSFNILGPMVRLSGNVNVGNGNFFGVQSIVLQGLKIGSYVKVGAGSVMMTKTKDNSLYMGNPAKIIRYL